VTSNTVQFSNATTGLVTTGNVEVGKELTVAGNVAVDTDTLYVDTVNDRVGIGTTSPDNALHIRNAIPSVLLDDSDDDTKVRITGGAGGDLYVDSNWGGSGNTGDIIFREASSEKMRIAGNGNVGIGTTNPSHALTVAAASGDAEVHIQAQGNDGGDAILYFNGSSTNQRKCAIISSNVAPNSWCKQDLHFCMETTSDSSDVDITDSKMVITNGGNVGIGVSNPTKMIHTKGEVVVGTDADNYTTQKGSLYFVRGVGRTNDGFGDRHHYISTRTEGNVGNGNNMTFHIDDGTTTNGTSHTSPLKLMGDGSVQLVGWKTKSWSGNTVNNGNRDVDVVTHSGLDSGVGIMAGIIEVIITRGGYAQQRAYARFHVNYSFWASAFRGNFDVLEKILTADVTDITLIISNNPAKIQVRITSPSTSTGQYYIKFDGPIYNPA